MSQTADKPIAETQKDPATSMIQVIERAAMSPDIDVDKMERLLNMQERIFNKQAETAFNQAMSTAQAEMGPVSADATNPQTKSKYASYQALDKALRPIYTRHGFSLSFDTEGAPQELYVRVVCHVSHADGHSRKHHVDMPADGKGAKGGDVMTKTHAAGSAMSYGMRYLLKLIFNVAVGEEDDDGNKATVPRITEEQANEIYALLNDNDLDKGIFMNWLRKEVKAESIEDINVKAFPRIKQALLDKVKAKNENS